MDILELAYLKQNIKNIEARLSPDDINFIKSLIIRNYNKLDSASIVFRWDNIKIILKLSCFLIDPEFLNGFLFSHIGFGKLFVFQADDIADYKNIKAIKYALRTGIINKIVLTQNKRTKTIYTESEFLGIENYVPYKNVCYVNQPKRRILKGIVFYDYLFKQPEENRINILVEFYDWLFKKYKVNDKNKVSGVVLDCHFNNFLKTKRGYYYFDRESLLNCNIDKSYILYRSLYETNYLEWYNYFLDY